MPHPRSNRLTDFRRGTLSASGGSGTPLDTVSTASHTQSWSLDDLGNMPSVTTDGTAVSRTHDDQNQIASIGGNSTWYSYGNLTFDGTYNYTYDVFNRLITVWNSDESATIATYAYDALGRRITENPTGGTTTEVYYSANWQALEDDQSSHAKNQYVWSPVYIDALIERDRDADNDGSHTLEERLYAQQDANFNLTAILNSSGSVQERYLFDPYGSRTVTDSSFTARSGNVSSFDWKYGNQGLRYDASGLLFARARLSSPTLGRFLTADPAGYSDGMNYYADCGDNSVTFTDPLGLAQGSQAKAVAPAQLQAILYPNFYYEAHVVSKSFINGVPLGTTGWLIPGFNDLLEVFARTTDFQFRENPLFDTKDGHYRLYARLSFNFTCTCTGEVNFARPHVGPAVDIDGGAEPFGLKGSIHIDHNKTIRMNRSVYHYAYRIYGSPSPIAEPSFQAVRLRTSTNIWHTVSGEFGCIGLQGFISTTGMRGSDFPSHRAWIMGGAPVYNLPQGKFSSLWNPDPGDPTFVN